MRGMSIFAVLLVAVTIFGCSELKTTPESLPVSSAGADKTQAELPPAGEIVVGNKPPMPQAIEVTDLPYKVEIVASGLVVPWDIAFVSKTRMYVTERPGRVRLINNGKLQDKPYAQVNSAQAGEGGLMGIALHPDYPNPRQVYLMYTYLDNDVPYNRVSRFRDTGIGLSDEKVLVEGIRGESYHDGGALRFGPDKMLYIGTGDAGQPERAQDLSSLNGKILRMTPDGKVPVDNPVKGSLVYAYGLRNVQGLAWNPKNGDLWATNHGPSGEFGQQAKDSVFIIKKGGNHGWPRSLGVTNIRGVVPPVLFYPNGGEPPALATFYNSDAMPDLRGNFFFATLRTEHLERVVIAAGQVVRIEHWFTKRYGRLRAVVQSPDGSLYITTSNRDLRGRSFPGDDKIIRITRN